MAVLDVAMASGFASLRRFNHLFRTRYRMAPAELRRKTPGRGPAERLSFDLAYRPPYDWDAMLAFLAKRAMAGVEAVDARSYSRTLRLLRGERRHAATRATATIIDGEFRAQRSPPLEARYKNADLPDEHPRP